MSERSFKTWNATLFIVITCCFLMSLTVGNSIMDIINMERVEKLLAERRENASLELGQEGRVLLQNSVDGDESFMNNDDDDDEVNPEGDTGETFDQFRLNGPRRQKPWHRFTDRPNHIHSTKGFRIRQNLTGIPDVSSLLADFASVKVEKMLKSDKNSQLVTKKEYLKKDWCKTEPILQKIREEGCLTRTILNRFCYGQCNSFYIPRNPPKRKKNRKKQGSEDESEDNSVFKSCGFCKPRRSSWIYVTLRCPTLVPQFRKKKIQRIKQCKCLSENFN